MNVHNTGDIVYWVSEYDEEIIKFVYLEYLDTYHHLYSFKSKNIIRLPYQKYILKTKEEAEQRLSIIRIKNRLGDDDVAYSAVDTLDTILTYWSLPPELSQELNVLRDGLLDTL